MPAPMTMPTMIAIASTRRSSRCGVADDDDSCVTRQSVSLPLNDERFDRDECKRSGLERRCDDRFGQQGESGLPTAALRRAAGVAGDDKRGDGGTEFVAQSEHRIDA